MFAPDGKRILVRDLNGYALKEAETGQELHRLADLGGWPIFSPDGRLLAALVSAPSDPANPTERKSHITLWRVPDGKVVGRFEARGPRFAFTPDGKTLAVSNSARAGGSYTINLVELATLKERRQFAATNDRPSAEPVLAFSPEGRILAEAENSDLRLRDIATGQELGVFAGHRGRISQLLFAPDGRTLTSVSTDTVLVWDMAGPQAKLPALASRLAPPDLERCWAELAGADVAKAYQAMWKLTGNPATAVPMLAAKLRPVPAPDPQKLERLLTELDAADAEVRERATAELEKLAELAEPVLRQVLAGKPSREVRQRVERLLERLDDRLGQAAYLPTLRGLEVLERIVTPEARQLLEKIATGAGGAIVTREARAALGR